MNDDIKPLDRIFRLAAFPQTKRQHQAEVRTLSAERVCAATLEQLRTSTNYSSLGS